MTIEKLSRRARILARLEELGGDGAKRSLGQNFLVSDHVVDKIIAAVGAAPFPQLLEVGPGLGAITEDLLKLEKPMTLIELDRRFAESWRARAAELPRLKVIEGDALKVDWRSLELPPETLFVSNLPYQISSTIVVDRSLEPANITRMVLMFQKEVAQRIAAKASTPEYGFLTVIAQAFWETSTVCDASPGDFYPSPKVSSRVLMFKRRTKGLEWLTNGEGSAKNYMSFARAGWAHRRKLLSRNLLGGWGPLSLVPNGLAEVERVFAAHGLKTTARVEELDPHAFVRLYLAMEKEFHRG